MSKLSDKLRNRARFETAASTSREQDHIDWIAADALDAMEAALGSAWYFIAAFDRDNAPNLLAEIKAALSKLEGK